MSAERSNLLKVLGVFTVILGAIFAVVKFFGKNDDYSDVEDDETFEEEDENECCGIDSFDELMSYDPEKNCLKLNCDVEIDGKVNAKKVYNASWN